MVDEISAGGIIVNNKKIVVVFQKRTQTWSLPKGHIDETETPEETARREIYEETGIKDLTLIKKLGDYIRGSKKKPGIKKQIIFFHFTTNQIELKPIDDDNPEAKWIPIDEVVHLLDYEKDKKFFLKIKDSLS